MQQTGLLQAKPGEVYFDRNTTDIIKGVALIFMFIHHFFTFPKWYIEGISYPELAYFAEYFCQPFKLCVPVFAFLSGYFYSFSCQKNYRHALRKISDVFLPYWLIYLVFLAIALLLGVYSFQWQAVLMEFFSLKSIILCFGWYVHFFAVSMLLFPLLYRQLEASKLRALLFGIVLPIAVCGVLEQWLKSPIFYYLRLYFPCMTIGFVIARFSLFQILFDPVFKRPLKYRAVQVPVWFILAAAAFLGRYYLPAVSYGILSFNMDILYAPLFVYAVANLVGCVPWKKIFFPLEYIGKYSLSMWLLHCIFFNCCKSFFQPILYAPRYPALVLLWGLLLCFAAAFLLEFPVKILRRWKNKIPLFS